MTLSSPSIPVQSGEAIMTIGEFGFFSRKRLFRMIASRDMLFKNTPGSLPVVDAMARAAGMARSHFTREFHRTVGQPLGEFARSCALKRAVGSLKNSLLPIKTIAFEAGFSSESAFSRAFKASFGCTPGRLRRPGAEGPASEEAGEKNKAR